MAIRPFTVNSYLVRLAAALVLVFATYNPSGYSFYHWAERILPNFEPLAALSGIVLLIGWVMFIRATIRSLGVFGVGLAGAFFGVLIWLLVDWGWLDPKNFQVLTYAGLAVLSAILATGLSWSHIRRRLSGQLDVDDVEDDEN